MGQRLVRACSDVLVERIGEPVYALVMAYEEQHTEGAVTIDVDRTQYVAPHAGGE